MEQVILYISTTLQVPNRSYSSFFPLTLCLLGLLGLVSCSPSNPKAKTIDVTPLIQQGDLAEAETILQEALTQHPGQPDLLYNLACVQRRQKQYSQARSSALKVLSFNPGDDQAILLLAQLELDMGKIQKAWDRLVQLSQQGRQSAKGQILIGSVHAKMGNWIEAEDAFRAALDLGASTALAKSSLAFVMLKLGQTQSGEQWLQEAETAPNQSESSLRQMAECFLVLGNAQKAKAIVNQLNPESKSDAQLWSILGRAELMQMAFGKAESMFTRAIAAPNSTPWNLVEYATMLFAAQREDEALQKALEAEKKLNTMPEPINKPSLYNLLATIYARRGQILLAQQYLEQSLQTDFNQTRVKELLDKIQKQTAAPIQPQIHSATP
ncbi:tetratricopeptide repeat protein [bacterium]|nr:tetratricopeptide repeat protein [bacterium]